MECEEMRGDSEVEIDSDHEDVEGDGHCGDGWLGHSLYNFHTGLDSDETGTVRRRPKTIVTPKMAMESFRLSFLNDDQDVNFDAILGELCELESQLNNTQSELSRSLASGNTHPPPPAAFQDGGLQSNRDTSHVSEQEELDQLATEITRGLHYHKTSNIIQQHHVPQHDHHLTVVASGVYGSGCLYDTAETDSAFSDNASLPSSESFTSMGTFSSSADTTSSSSGETCSMNSGVCGVSHGEDEQIARKAEKIRIALEKIKDAKIRKLFVRAFAKDGSSKSILVDEKMTISQVCSQLADKNHMRLNHKLSVVELMPELLMERILEDHDSLVENMVMWTKDSKNKIMFEEKMDKYDLFRNPEKYLLNAAGTKQGPLTPQQKDRLIQEFFAPDSICVPAVEGALYLKSDGKKAWKKFFFVLRASGLYYSPKGKTSKNSKDLVCLVQFEYVEVYHGLGWKKKYHAPTDYCFALKHPQIQKKTSKYIRYFCAESEATFDQWVMGIRTVKLGKQMLHNYEHLTQEISMWDLRQPETGSVTADTSVCQMLNHADLNDSRMSVPEPGGCHSVIQVLSRSLVHKCAVNDTPRNAMSLDVLAGPPHKVSESGGSLDGRSLSGSIGSSSIGSSISESGHKTPIKRVSFSKTHSIINGDSSEQTVRHRDSIISSSTDSSEDSNTSGETRLGSSFRGKMRPKLPVTTETTRQLADMCNVTIDETAEGIYAETHYHRPQVNFSRSDRKRSSMPECRRPHGSSSSEYGHRSVYGKSSSGIKQHSMDSGSDTSHVYNKQISSGSEGYYQHIGRRSEQVSSSAACSKPSSSIYSTIYSPLREEQHILTEVDMKSSYGTRHEDSEKIYNQIKCPTPTLPNETARERLCSATIPPPPQFREVADESNHLPPTAVFHTDKLVSEQLMQAPRIMSPVPFSSSVISAEMAKSQQKLHSVKESQYHVAVPLSSSSHSKSSLPPTLPKPNISSMSIANSMKLKINELPNDSLSPPFCSPSNEPPIHSSVHVSTHPLVTTTTSSKIPPPTLPKSSLYTRAASPVVTGCSLRSSLHAFKPPVGDRHLSEKTGQAGSSLAKSDGEYKIVPENEMTSCHFQSSTLPLAQELSRRHPEPQVDNSSVEIRSDQPLSASSNSTSASTGSVAVKLDKKTAPPPPPKRNENTRLSIELTRQQNQCSEQNGICVQMLDPVYENVDDMMNIDELPPPPPELLMDLPSSECEEPKYGSTKKPKPPPPPPKRSKETQIFHDF